MKISTLALTVAGAAILCAGIAHAQGIGVATIQDTPAQQVQSTVADILMFFLAALASLVAAWVKKKWNIDADAALRSIEAAHRDTLHSAVQTAVGAAWAKWGPQLSFDPNSQSGKFITAAVKASAPEAVAALKASESWMLSAAASKLALSQADTTAIAAFANTVAPGDHNPNPPAPAAPAPNTNPAPLPGAG